MADIEKPLSGVTVVELGHSVAAPYAGLILADLGARVIKVENPAAEIMPEAGVLHSGTTRRASFMLSIAAKRASRSISAMRMIARS